MNTEKPITVTTLHEMKQRGEKFACLTAYDATFTCVLEQAGVEVILVGDSLGMVIQGHDTTIPVTVDDIAYHTRAVARTRERALIMADMPFMSYASPEQAIETAAYLMQEGGAHMVKLEGGEIQTEIVYELTLRGVPVCAHLGLTPQSIHKLGGYKVQGRDQQMADTLREDAHTLQDAGADLVLLECVPAALAAEITQQLDIPVIGIGAGVDCDAQVLVLQDVLGITPGHRPKFSKDFMSGSSSILDAVTRYVQAVKSGSFPAAEHTFN